MELHKLMNVHLGLIRLSREEKMARYDSDLRNDMMKIVRQAIAAVDPMNAVRAHCVLEDGLLHVGSDTIDLNRYGRINVIGAGKASAFMAKALEEMLGDRIRGGVISTKKGYDTKLKKVALIEAGHPLPDKNSFVAAQKAVEEVRSLGADDLIICLLSGGASALWTLPAASLDLEDKIKTTQSLLACGADIHEINAIRKHISGIKGGRLACASYPARLITLAISDVVGDEYSSIGSGPTVADPTTYEQAIGIVKKYSLQEELPPSVLRHLEAGRQGREEETPKPGDCRLDGNIQNIITSNRQAIEAAMSIARHSGYNTYVISYNMTGEARIVGRRLASIAKEVVEGKGPISPPAILLSGGETTVTVRGRGKGGRNQELALAAAMEISGWNKISVVSVGTDGADGPTDAAGAVADGNSIERGRAMEMDAKYFLDQNDSYTYFDMLGDLIRIGPTGTNVMDIQVIAISA